MRRLSVLTSGAQQVGSDEDVSAAQGSVWGLSRSIALEYPDWRCKPIDLDPANEQDDEALLAELIGDQAEDQVAFRSGVRHVSRLVRIAPATAAAPDRSRTLDRSVRLEIPQRGLLDNLRLEPAASWSIKERK